MENKINEIMQLKLMSSARPSAVTFWIFLMSSIFASLAWKVLRLGGHTLYANEKCCLCLCVCVSGVKTGSKMRNSLWTNKGKKYVFPILIYKQGCKSQ